MLDQNKKHLVISALIFAVGLLIILVFVAIRSQADDVDTSVSITNANPVVTSIRMGSSTTGNQYDNGSVAITLTENGTTTIYINGVLTDDNGCEEIDTTSQLKATFFKQGTACDPDSASEDKTNCYYVTDSDCNISGCSGGTTENYYCSIGLGHVADAANWYAMVDITDDNAGTVETTSSVYATIDTLTALNLQSASINWGSVALAASSSDQNITIENSGNNNDLDLGMSGTLMNCSLRGTIPVGNVKYATGTVDYTAKTAMTTTSASFNFSLAKGTDLDTLPSDDINFQVQIPSSDTAGTCSGTVVIITD